MKRSNGTVGGGDPYSASVAFIKMEAGSNTFLADLRVVGGEEKGSLKSETVKYGRESHGTRIRE
jgi:hypothetical protein